MNRLNNKTSLAWIKVASSSKCLLYLEKSTKDMPLDVNRNGSELHGDIIVVGAAALGNAIDHNEIVDLAYANVEAENGCIENVIRRGHVACRIPAVIDQGSHIAWLAKDITNVVSEGYSFTTSMSLPEQVVKADEHMHYGSFKKQGLDVFMLQHAASNDSFNTTNRALHCRVRKYVFHQGISHA